MEPATLRILGPDDAARYQALRLDALRDELVLVEAFETRHVG